MAADEVIRINSLSFVYPDGRTALKDINFTINRGETVAIIGPNGAGKSTLLLHFNGILHNNKSVTILGKPLEDNNLRWVKSRVGMVFQNPDDQLFSPTVFDDVAYGPQNLGYAEDQVQDMVQQALKTVDMSGFEKRSPYHLSLGEKKRVAIATVLSMSPEILVFDEPTSNLDPRGRWSIIQLFRTLPATKLIATHDLDLVNTLCSRTILLDQGRLIADKATPQILSDIPLLKKCGLAPE